MVVDDADDPIIPQVLVGEKEVSFKGVETEEDIGTDTEVGSQVEAGAPKAETEADAGADAYTEPEPEPGARVELEKMCFCPEEGAGEIRVVGSE